MEPDIFPCFNKCNISRHHETSQFHNFFDSLKESEIDIIFQILSIPNPDEQSLCQLNEICHKMEKSEQFGISERMFLWTYQIPLKISPPTPINIKKTEMFIHYFNLLISLPAFNFSFLMNPQKIEFLCSFINGSEFSELINLGIIIIYYLIEHIKIPKFPEYLVDFLIQDLDQLRHQVFIFPIISQFSEELPLCIAAMKSLYKYIEFYQQQTDFSKIDFGEILDFIHLALIHHFPLQDEIFKKLFQDFETYIDPNPMKLREKIAFYKIVCYIDNFPPSFILSLIQSLSTSIDVELIKTTCNVISIHSQKFPPDVRANFIEILKNRIMGNPPNPNFEDIHSFDMIEAYAMPLSILFIFEPKYDIELFRIFIKVFPGVTSSTHQNFLLASIYMILKLLPPSEEFSILLQCLDDISNSIEECSESDDPTISNFASKILECIFDWKKN